MPGALCHVANSRQSANLDHKSGCPRRRRARDLFYDGNYPWTIAKRRDGREAYDETDLEIVRAAAELSKFGVGGRNLRVFRTSADREAALLEQLLGASLRSRSQARRKEAVENLESLAAVCGHLKHLLLVRDLRRLTATAE